MNHTDYRMGWAPLAAMIAAALPFARPSRLVSTPRPVVDQSVRAAQDIDPATEPELPDGVWDEGPGRYFARCRSCERDYELCYDPSEFTEEGNYCGGSDRCIP